MKSKNPSAEPRSPRSIAAGNKVLSPCIPCQEKRQGCSRDSPCLRCRKRGIPELCIRRTRSASGAGSGGIRTVQETGQRTESLKRDCTSPKDSFTCEDGSSVPSSLSPTEMGMGRHEELGFPEESLPSGSYAFFGSPICESPTDYTVCDDDGQSFRNGETSFHEGEQMSSHSLDHGASASPSEVRASQPYDQEMLLAHNLPLSQNGTKDPSMEQPLNHGAIDSYVSEHSIFDRRADEDAPIDHMGLPNSTSSLPAPLQTCVDVNSLVGWNNSAIQLQEFKEILEALDHTENMTFEDTSGTEIQGNIPDHEYADEAWTWLHTPIEENYQSGLRGEVLQTSLHHQNFVQLEDTSTVDLQMIWNNSNPGTEAEDHGRSDTSLFLPAEIQLYQAYENGLLLPPSEGQTRRHPLSAAYYENGSSASSNGIIGGERGQIPFCSPLHHATHHYDGESREPPDHVSLLRTQFVMYETPVL